MNQAAIAATFRQTGLGFIADKMHPNWSTETCEPTRPRWGSPAAQRSNEISLWLQSNPEFKDRWVILDDEYSGTGLGNWPVVDEQQFIVLCSPCVGLGISGFEQLWQAVETRIENYCGYQND
jgi:hypothetical protein